MINVRLVDNTNATVAEGQLDEELVSTADRLIYKDQHYSYAGMAGGRLLFRPASGHILDVTELLK